jgi:hypothetical protein
MFSGELEASNLNLGNNDAFYSIIFIMFVFLISIVLLNLINGLSVSDVFQIKAEGHLVDLCQKIHVLNKYEKIIMGRDTSLNFLKSIISIFPEFVKDNKIIIDSNGEVEIGTTGKSVEIRETLLARLYNDVLKLFYLMIQYVKNKLTVSKHNMRYRTKRSKVKAEGFKVQIDRRIMHNIENFTKNQDLKSTNIDNNKRMKDIDDKLALIMKALDITQ